MIDLNRIAPKAHVARAACAGLIALLLALCTVGPAAAQDSGARSDADPRGQYVIPNLFADIAEKTLPSVVAVYVRHDLRAQMQEFRSEFFDDPAMKKFFDDPSLRRFLEPGGDGSDGDDPHAGLSETLTSGSGVIISSDGFIVTNNHIVENARQGMVRIVLNDDTEIDGDKVTIVARDPLLDLAIIKIDAEGYDLKPLAWGDSSRLRVGEWVLAIGNPMDLRGSVSKGIISAKSRKIKKVPIEHLLQTDAMINPGNSGGALVNLDGELIGINMAIATNTGLFQGIGFAIPSNDARFITDQVIKDGRIRRGYIGILMSELGESNLRDALGLDEDAKGVLVEEVFDGTPADKAGVERYDVITAVDGEAVEDNGDLIGLIAGKRVGADAEVSILRSVKGKVRELALRMKVTERPAENDLRPRSFGRRPVKPVEVIEPESDALGLRLKPYSGPDQMGMKVEDVEARSPAARSGIGKGDIILEINRTPVSSQKDYDRKLAEADGGPILLRYYSVRRGQAVIIGIRPSGD